MARSLANDAAQTRALAGLSAEATAALCVASATGTRAPGGDARALDPLALAPTRTRNPARPMLPVGVWIKPVKRRKPFVVCHRAPAGGTLGRSFATLEEAVAFAWSAGGRLPITDAPGRQLALDVPAGATRPGPAPLLARAPAPAPGTQTPAPTLAEFCEAWITERAPSWSEGTLAQVRRRTGHYLGLVGGLPLSSFGPAPCALISGALVSLTDRFTGITDINKGLENLQTMFDAARARHPQAVPENPVHGIAKLRPTTPRKAALHRALTPTEVERLRRAHHRLAGPVCPIHGRECFVSVRGGLDCFVCPTGREGHVLADEALADYEPELVLTQAAVIVEVLSYVGLRPGEIAPLTWGDLRHEGWLWVWRQVQGDRVVVLKQTSNRGAPVQHKAPVPEPVAESLEAIRPPGARMDDLIFAPQPPARPDHPARRYFDWKRFRARAARQAAERAGVEVHGSDGRHTAASLWIHAGSGLGDVAQWLGHASPRTTIAHYLQLYTEAQKLARIPVDDAIRQAREAVFGVGT